jgi:hypothetical protein
MQQCDMSSAKLGNTTLTNAKLLGSTNAQGHVLGSNGPFKSREKKKSPWWQVFGRNAAL